MGTVCYLDVDGVLNTDDDFRRLRSAARGETSMRPLNIELIANYIGIVAATGCKTIITSHWRFQQAPMAKLLEANVPYDGMVEAVTGPRGGLIHDHMKTLPKGTRVAILDDKFPTLLRQSRNVKLFLLDQREGLTARHAEKITNYLNGEK